MTDSFLSLADYYDCTRDFPAGPCIDSNTVYFMHPNTGAVYVWLEDKKSWSNMANTGSIVYTSKTDPESTGTELHNGDMWWDPIMLEMRVWHKPDTTGTGQIIPKGFWVSSTNPQMSQDSDRNMVIGTLEVIYETPLDEIYEDEQTRWTVNVLSNTPKEYLKYTWEVSPPSIHYNNTTYEVEIFDGDTESAVIFWNEGTYKMEPNIDTGVEEQITYKVQCKVEPKDEYVDKFAVIKKFTTPYKVAPKPKRIETMTDYNTNPEIMGTVDDDIKFPSVDKPFVEFPTAPRDMQNVDE